MVERARSQPRRRRLSPQDWADTALAAIGDGGLAAVAVEPLAAKLGATKGSFYWHFRNRRDLLAASLELWEQRHTQELIARLEEHADPRERLRTLLALVVRVSRQDRIEMALLASADDPVVGPVLARVTRERLAYLVSLYRQLGLDDDAASHRAVLALSTYLGHVQLAHVASEVLPAGEERWEDHVDTVVAALLP